MTRQRIGAGLIGLLLWAAPSSAQVLAGPTGLGALNARLCATSLAQVSTVVFQLTGTYTGEVTFQATSNGVTYDSVEATKTSTGAVSATTTSTGLYAVPNYGYVQMCATMTTFSGGGANVLIVRGYGAGGTGGGGGVASDVDVLSMPVDYGVGAVGSETLRTITSSNDPVSTSAVAQEGTIENGAQHVTVDTLPNGPDTGNAITVTADTSSSAEIFAANAVGKGWMCANTSTVSLFIAYTVTAAVASAPIEVLPNQMWVDPFGFIGSVKGIWGTRAGASDPGTGSSLCQGVQ